MFNKIKILSLTACSVFLLQSCHSDDDALFDTPSDSAPTLVNNISTNGYASLRGGSAALDGLFLLAGTVSGTADSDLCAVKTHKMLYDTIDGVGATTKSSGVVMVPYGDSAACSGSRPVVLYAHGTNADSDYDLSQLAASPANPAASEAGILLAFYASKGYVVVAPNYAGYANVEGGLDYHPYVDEKQQSTEMMDALNHVRTHAGDIGADLSSKLFISGLSQGGYVAMATHKALEAEGETVTASVPVSGPYAMGTFLDTVMVGYVNGGATTFAPMYLTALERAHDIYDNADEVYAAPYAATAENAMPAPGVSAAVDAGLPEYALFSATSQPALPTGGFTLGYGADHLFSDTFRTEYLTAAGGATTANAAYKVRELAKEADLQDWTPAAPVVMCGSNDDPVVYHLNSNAMAGYWSGLVSAGLVTNLDLTDTPSGNFALIQGAWQQAGVATADIHGTTGVYCAGAGLALFNTL